MATRLIGIMGKKRHGKDTFASRLTSAHGFTRYAFADPMRDALYRLNPLVRIEADEAGPLREAGAEVVGDSVVNLRYLVDRAGWDAAKATREVRRLLQEYGTGLRDTTHPDVWVDARFTAVDAHLGPVVITDVRFPNEVDAVRSRGGLLVWVDNPNVPDSGDTHPSEVSVSAKDADRVVTNSSTIGDLYRLADAVVSRTSTYPV